MSNGAHAIGLREKHWVSGEVSQTSADASHREYKLRLTKII